MYHFGSWFGPFSRSLTVNHPFRLGSLSEHVLAWTYSLSVRLVQAGSQFLWSVSVTPGAQFVLSEPRTGVVQQRVKRSVVLNKAEVAAPKSRERRGRPGPSDEVIRAVYKWAPCGWCLLNISALSPVCCSRCRVLFLRTSCKDRDELRVVDLEKLLIRAKSPKVAKNYYQ